MENQGSVSVESLSKRIFMFLEEENWFSADEYTEKLLDIDPENASAYLGKLMVNLRVSRPEKLGELNFLFDNEPNFQKIVRFGDKRVVDEVNSYLEQAKQNYFSSIVDFINQAKSENEYLKAADMLLSIIDYKNSKELRNKCFEKAKICHADAIYFSAVKDAEKGSRSGYKSAIEKFSSIPDWKDSKQQISMCENNLEAQERTILKRILICVAVFFAFIMVFIAVVATGPLREASAMEDQLVGVYEHGSGRSVTFNPDNTFSYSYGTVVDYGTWEIDTDKNLILNYEESNQTKVIYNYNSISFAGYWYMPEDGTLYLNGLHYK